MKFYLHRKILFEDYRKIDQHFPDYDDNYTLGRFIEEGIYEVPITWISPPIPKDITLQLNYTFKFNIYANCSNDALGNIVATFWRYRDQQETFLYRSNLSPPIYNSSFPENIVWYEFINKTINFNKDDRLIVKLFLKVFERGFFWFGFDCKNYPSYISDPDTETLRPNSDGILIEFPNQYPDSGNHYDKVDEDTPDEWDTYVYTSLTGTTTYSDCYNLPDTSIEESSTINSVTVYIRVACSMLMTTGRGYAWSLLRTYSTYYYGDQLRPSDSFITFSTTYTTNPNTGLAWTISEINALQIGARAKSGYYYDPIFGYEYYSTDLTQTYVVVEYTVEEEGETYTKYHSLTVNNILIHQRIGTFTRYHAITPMIALTYQKEGIFVRYFTITSNIALAFQRLAEIYREHAINVNINLVYQKVATYIRESPLTIDVALAFQKIGEYVRGSTLDINVFLDSLKEAIFMRSSGLNIIELLDHGRYLNLLRYSDLDILTQLASSVWKVVPRIFELFSSLEIIVKPNQYIDWMMGWRPTYIARGYLIAAGVFGLIFIVALVLLSREGYL